MFVEIVRVSLRDIGVDITPRVDPPPAGRAHTTDALAGLAVLSVGRGGPVHAAVNRALRTAGAVVLVKTSAEEVTQMLGTFIPSAIVTEVVSGDDGGLAVLRAIRQLPPERGGHLPIVGVSGEAIDPTALTGEGFQGVLVGPLDEAEVARAVLRAIDRPS